MTTLTAQSTSLSIWSAIRANWRIYAIDGALLGIFMISACVSVAALEYPASPIHRWIESDFLRRAIIGFCMGLTAVALIYCPWGRRSGAFMNPAMILGFVRLGRLKLLDAIGYIAAQFIGSALGMMISALLLGSIASHPSVNYVVTTPGTHGLLAAWAGEFFIAALMISVVMAVNKIPSLAPFTGCFAATLVVLYITFEAPLSGMSLNPARTFGSSIVANLWTGWWIYLTAPIAGIIFGIQLHRWLTAEHQNLCGKLNHSRGVACFIRCNCLEGKS
jgi:aquaporin Z